MNTLRKLSPSSSTRSEFLDFISEKAYPCVGVKTALSTDQLHIFEATDLRCPADDRAILQRVQKFVADYERSPSLFQSLVILFRGPCDLDEEQFEKALWDRLQKLHELDCEDYAWDPRVSSNPSDDSFSFSLAGRAFYVVGMHPNSSRKARQSPFPALALNLHDQFERLRSTNEYARIKSVVRRRDKAWSGSTNPMLSDFKAGSEASQYSGREVPGDWKCPFSPLH